MIQKLLQLELREVLIPIAVLAAGACISFLFRLNSGSKSFGIWQWWIPVLLYALFIFFLSNRSYPDAVPTFSTKIFHPIEYAVLGLLLCLAWFSVPGKKGLLSLAIRVLSVGLLYAASDEFHQAFIPGRTPRIVDVVVWDFLGLCLGCVMFLLIGFLLRDTNEATVESV